jgi:aspartate/methionine/tyrosine aminotransferase
MTGFRIGCVLGPEAHVRAITNIQSETTGCPNALSQSAWESALLEEPAEVAGWVASFQRRRDLLVAGLRELGLECTLPGGAFYAFPDATPFLDERGSAGLCEDLLESEQLVLVPGSVFGMDSHVRLSYALGEPDLERALKRLGRFLESRRG